MRKKRFRAAALLFAVALLIVALNFNTILKKIYPCEYSYFVNKLPTGDVDTMMIYAVIRTESGFDSSAESEVGARGLMQLTEDTFEWVKFRMGDERDITFDDMYNAETNITYGVYLLGLLYDEYGSYPETLAAYHAGRGAVNSWLENKEYSSDGKTLDKIPIRDTNHYVHKVMKAYEAYKNIYD